MSEPLSAVEIEDVLSSIRRLVSEDLRPQIRGPFHVDPTPARPALILTPALRVVPQPEPKVSEPVLPEPQASEPLAGAPVEHLLASVGASVAANDVEWESETGDPAPDSVPVWQGADWDVTDADTAVSAAAKDVLVEFVHAQAHGGDAPGWAQSGSDDSADFESAPHPLPDPQSADAEWVAQTEAEVIAGLNQAEDVDLSGSQVDVTFDEDVLRDLVRDLIREELQGHLGERITRNIRKLVRAEIARALTVADLD